MARFTDRETLIEAIADERSRLQAALDSLSPAEMTTPGVSGKGKWSVKDLLAHLTEWEQMVLAWCRAGQRGEKPKTPAPDLTWRQLPELNRRIYEKHRQRSLRRVLAESEASYEEILRIVRAMPKADLFDVGRFAWPGKVPLSSYFAACTSSHYRWARTRVERWQRARVRAAAPRSRRGLSKRSGAR